MFVFLVFGVFWTRIIGAKIILFLFCKLFYDFFLLSLRAKRSNLVPVLLAVFLLDCFVATLLAMTRQGAYKKKEAAASFF